MRKKYIWACVIGLTALAAASLPVRADSLESVIEGAKKEGALVVGDSTNSRAMAKVVDAFVATYPFISIEHMSEGGADMPNRIRQEAGAKVPASVDVFVVGFPEGARLATEGFLQPVDWAGLGLPQSAISNEFQVVAANVLTAFIYNTNLLTPEQAPHSWEDLLKPELKGKVVVGIDGWNTMAADLVNAWGEQKVDEYTLALKAQAVTVARVPEVAPRITSGEYPVGIVRLQQAKGQKASGAPVGWTIPSPNPSPVLSWQVPVNAQHSNAAKLWVAWIMSAEGHKIYEEAAGRGNASLPGSITSGDVVGVTLSVDDGDPATREHRTALERKYQQMMQAN